MKKHALTGPAAAAALGWEGFNKHGWPSLWCVSGNGKRGPQTIRTRSDLRSSFLGEQEVANPILILRHLGEFETELGSRDDDLTALERIEMALEYALRRNLICLDALRSALHHGRTRGDQLLRHVLFLRGGEPPAESYAEVLMVQAFRSWGIVVWRQVPVYENGKLKHRIDFVIPFDPRRPRPRAFLPDLGLGVEVDSFEFHDERFEEDHLRQTTYDVLGLHWMTVTPSQLKRTPKRIHAAVERRFVAACRAQRVKSAQPQLALSA